MKKGEKILLLCSRSVTVAYFRMNLIRDLIAAGYDVTVAPLDRDREAEIRATGADFVSMDGENRSLNPVRQLMQIRRYRALIRKVRPDIVFCFQAVPNMLGGISARLEKVKKVFCMVEGAGDVFALRGLKWSLARLISCMLYKPAFKKAQKIMFLNKEDEEEFLHRRLVRREQCARIPGVGVDLEKFSCLPLPEEPVFIMVSRLMESKGALDYCRAARLAKKQRPEARFLFLGEEFTLKKADIQEYIDDGSMEYPGYSKEVHEYLGKASVFVLPSFYREGLPMTIMEAMATGRPVITTDAVGCRDAVVDGENGWIVPMRDPEALAEKMLEAIDHPGTVAEMGRKARAYAEEVYDVNRIDRQILDLIEE